MKVVVCVHETVRDGERRCHDAVDHKELVGSHCSVDVVVHLSDHNPVMVALVDYHIRAEQSINGQQISRRICRQESGLSMLVMDTYG